MLNQLLSTLRRIKNRVADERRAVGLKNWPQIQMIVHTTYDQFISRQIAEKGEWEPFETEVVAHFLRPGDVLVDIGANIGWYTLIAANIVGSRGRVYAFEPAKENYDIAARNLALNGFRNVTLERLAISNSTGAVRLFLSPENLGDHRLYESTEIRACEIVATTTIEKYFADKPAPIRVVKIDTQGSEGLIFEGIPDDFVTRRGVAAFIVEFWPLGLSESGSSAAALVRRMRALRLDCFVIHESISGLEPISLETIEERAAHGNLCPERGLFLNLLALPSANPVSPWIQAHINHTAAPYI
jgi:FkbM family methyltransferase